jgi:hypothetical protein
VSGTTELAAGTLMGLRILVHMVRLADLDNPLLV